MRGQIKIVKKLLDENANVDVTDTVSYTLLVKNVCIYFCPCMYMYTYDRENVSLLVVMQLYVTCIIPPELIVLVVWANCTSCCCKERAQGSSSSSFGS